MILCLVTDRRRLGAVLGLPEAAWTEALRQQVIGAAAGGVDFIQVREPDLEAAELAALVRSLIAASSSSKAKILVNDRIDVALATGASGVHLKEQSILPSEVRRIAPREFVIGCSVHDAAAVAARKSADFLTAGTVMPTASKRAVDYLSKDGLSRIVEAAAGQPVLGIGGLDLPSIPLLASAGAAGMAAIGAFMPQVAGGDVAENVQKRVAALRFALESATKRP
jgi:thiamine-phosphate pyrophosphorylase